MSNTGACAGWQDLVQCNETWQARQGLFAISMVMIHAKADYHLIRELPHVNPPPKAVSKTRSPGWMVPSLTASSRAMGIVAEEMFPYLSMFT